MSSQVKYRALALLGLCSLMSSSVARADDCDTPAAESCACMSQVGKTPRSPTLSLGAPASPFQRFGFQARW
jgi:hypothetical protein